jgi:hypothetical protein
MRSYKGKDYFFKKMKKKPAQQEVIDNIDDYTVEQLENLRGSTFPKWVREALVRYKERDSHTPEEMALKFANEMTKATLDKKE